VNRDSREMTLVITIGSILEHTEQMRRRMLLQWRSNLPPM